MVILYYFIWEELPFPQRTNELVLLKYSVIQRLEKNLLGTFEFTAIGIDDGFFGFFSLSFLFSFPYLQNFLCRTETALEYFFFIQKNNSCSRDESFNSILSFCFVFPTSYKYIYIYFLYICRVFDSQKKWYLRFDRFIYNAINIILFSSKLN